MEENEMEQKELELISLKRDLENANRELDLNRNQIDTLKIRRDFLKREMDLVEKQTMVAMNHWKLLKPTWEFEQLEEYVELGKEFAKLNFEKKMYEHQQQLENFNKLIDSVEQQYQAVLEHRDNLQTKLDEGDSHE